MHLVALSSKFIIEPFSACALVQYAESDYLLNCISNHCLGNASCPILTSMDDMIARLQRYTMYINETAQLWQKALNVRPLCGFTNGGTSSADSLV